MHVDAAAVQPRQASAPRPRSTPPVVTVGLPVYNGEAYLEEALDALLAQSFTDFELVISDNASTDRTAEICHAYAERDPRIRYVRQPRNIGAAPNHNALVPLARGRYFKWASHDDLYEPELLQLCVDALEAHPDVVLAHGADALLDAAGQMVRRLPYTLDTEVPDPARRLRSLLVEPGGNDFYGVIRTDVLRRVRPHGSYYNADRTFMAGLVLHGPFHHVPQVVYYRRDHPDRASHGSRRTVAEALDPARRSRLRHPMPMMRVEYLWGFVAAVRRSRLGRRDRLRCYVELVRWGPSRLWKDVSGAAAGARS